MKRTHALIIALALAIAVVAGSFAALRTTQLGAKATTPQVNSIQIAQQNRALDRAAAALRAELKHKPPAISTLHQATHVVAAQTVIYHRAAPIVHVIHRAGGGEHESSDRGGGGGGGGGLDD
jgi:hypothetical protein